MLIVLFVISLFSSLGWLGYIILYIHGQLAGNDLSAQTPALLAVYAGLTVLPIWAVWQIFGLVSQFGKTRATDKSLQRLFNQMKKNQDYTDLVVRVMLDAEHEIKDGFVIGKFDVFVADLNEILADILQRCNAASSLQMEQLWARVKNGERWTIGKSLIEAAQMHTDFSAYLKEKALKDSVFKGTLMEFCARYQNLSAMLEKHDRDRVFIAIIETGVMGKVYSLLAPVADSLDQTHVNEPTPTQAEVSAAENAEDYTVSPRIFDMPEPASEEERLSFWDRLNPFRRTKTKNIRTEPELGHSEDEAFFAALQKSMSTPDTLHQDLKIRAENEDRPEKEPFLQTAPTAAEENIEPQASFFDRPDQSIPLAPTLDTDKTAEQSEAFSREFSDAELQPVRVESKQEEKPGKDNFSAYPFSGWLNEDNYKK